MVLREKDKGRKKSRPKQEQLRRWKRPGKKTTGKMYGLNSEEELNGDLGTKDHDDDSCNDNEEHIPIAKGRPIKNNKRNKISSPTVKETFLKVTHNKEINEEDKYETKDTSYNKKEDEY